MFKTPDQTAPSPRRLRPATGRPAGDPSVTANAAVYYAPEGYSTAGPELMGINAACEGMLRAMAVHMDVDRLYAFAETPESGAAFAEAVRGFNPAMTTEWIPTQAAERLAAVETLQLPGPGLAAYAWMRRRVGPRSFSLCGVTHTTATAGALDNLTELWTAPVEPWDALICPSVAVRSMVSTVLEDQRLYLTERFGAFSVPRPQLPVIPLGVDAPAFAADAKARASWRTRLAVREGEVVLLYMGRLNPWAKSHPTPLFLGLAAAARRTTAPLHLVLGGWFADPRLHQAYLDAAEMICPTVRISVVDGRQPDARRGLWQAADVFVSPVDNVQETFGLTPLEAMAAGLPVVASDWDGYRETVRHGIDGLLAPTVTPPAGSSVDLATAFGARTIGYDYYVGLASQATAVDVSALGEAIAALSENPALRRSMGDEGRRQAAARYDWRHIIAEYQQLWVNLGEQRKAAKDKPVAGPAWPARPEPFRAFASYPTIALTGETVIALGDTAPVMIEVLLQSPLISFAQNGLPRADTLSGMLQMLESGPVAAHRAVAVGGGDTQVAWRGLVWLMKYGFIRTPAG